MDLVLVNVDGGSSVTVISRFANCSDSSTKSVDGDLVLWTVLRTGELRLLVWFPTLWMRQFSNN